MVMNGIANSVPCRHVQLMVMNGITFFLYNLFIDFSIIKYNTIYYDTVYNLNTLTEARAKAKRI